MEKIDLLNTPPIIGEYYLVPCIIKEDFILRNSFDLEWKEDILISKSFYEKQMIITPILNHKHSDRENRQQYEHYHIDFRFIAFEGDGINVKKIDDYDFTTEIRFNIIEENIKHKIQLFPLKCITNKQKWVGGITKNSKLKHKCIHKGKCPHRGYDLSKEVPVDGIITCPLHGLKFNSENKKIII